MCLSPITIPNQSKYISLSHRDQFLMQVPCGHCAECQRNLSTQWYFRSYYEWLDVEKSNGYVLFDTLTYSNKYLPHLSDTWSFLGHSEDFPCFDFHHIRTFYQSLVQRVKRAGYGSCLRYFLSSEYGTHDTYNGRKCTHRPHYHLLLYVHNSNLPPLWLSKQISELWFYGRTDGIPYKSAKYVLGKNVLLSSDGLSSKLRTIHYVTKYVQKSCEFQSEINRRRNLVMFRLADFADPVTPEKWLSSESAHRVFLQLGRLVNQFHRQSQHFGESALADIDLNEIMRTGCLFMPDFKHVKIPVPLPMYYKRKLCSDLIEFNGSRYWVTNDFGKQYKDARRNDNLKRLADRYRCLCEKHNLDIDCNRLADYCLNVRGRIRGDLPESTLIDRIDSIDLFNYSTGSDKLNFGCRGLSNLWLGDSQQGYDTSHLFNRIALPDFIAHYVEFIQDRESELDKIYFCMSSLNESKQNVFALKQKLTQLYKFCSSPLSDSRMR